VDVVLFEGWCVGARAQAAAMLAEPVNELERLEDSAGLWRRAVNDALTGANQQIFARIDVLALLAAPGFDVVAGWRTQQEHELHRRTGHGMSDAEVARFVLFYERLTRHILSEMPDRADVLIRIDRARKIEAFIVR
jgi:D-glycerate 3-kinase